MNRFSDNEKQLFWNLKFHAVLSTILAEDCDLSVYIYVRHTVFDENRKKVFVKDSISMSMRKKMPFLFIWLP